MRSSKGRVNADRPGPISTTRSSRAGPMARTIDSTTLSSVRKCWPKRLRAWCADMKWTGPVGC
ncbi:Uncharacterised protein [Bordetella pertussis]|nr:Uncharacterised protein [Bordetella pertussis]CFW47142.1 Uncharacterised protein [Bordetella pertussis]